MPIEINRKTLTDDDSCLWASDEAASAECWKPASADPGQSSPVGNPPTVLTVCKGRAIRWRAAADNN